MKVRDAIGADAEAIERIRVRGWQVAYRGIYPAAFLDRLAVDWSRWQERLAHPPAGWSSFVVERDGRVVGFAIAGPDRDDPGVGELYALYVDPDSWSRGAGRALLRHAEGRLAERYDEATLWVLEGNPRARHFYELSGWRPDGASRPFPHGGAAPYAVRYRKRLRMPASRS